MLGGRLARALASREPSLGLCQLSAATVAFDDGAEVLLRAALEGRLGQPARAS